MTRHFILWLEQVAISTDITSTIAVCAKIQLEAVLLIQGISNATPSPTTAFELERHMVMMPAATRVWLLNTSPVIHLNSTQAIDDLNKKCPE